MAEIHQGYETVSIENSFSELRQIIIKYNLDVKTSGKGRTKKKIIDEINAKLKLHNVNPIKKIGKIEVAAQPDRKACETTYVVPKSNNDELVDGSIKSTLMHKHKNDCKTGIIAILLLLVLIESILLFPSLSDCGLHIYCNSSRWYSYQWPRCKSCTPCKQCNPCVCQQCKQCAPCMTCPTCTNTTISSDENETNGTSNGYGNKKNPTSVPSPGTDKNNKTDIHIDDEPSSVPIEATKKLEDMMKEWLNIDSILYRSTSSQNANREEKDHYDYFQPSCWPFEHFHMKTVLRELRWPVALTDRRIWSKKVKNHFKTKGHNMTEIDNDRHKLALYLTKTVLDNLYINKIPPPPYNNDITFHHTTFNLKFNYIDINYKVDFRFKIHGKARKPDEICFEEFLNIKRSWLDI